MSCIEVMANAAIADASKDAQQCIPCPLPQLWRHFRYLHKHEGHSHSTYRSGSASRHAQHASPYPGYQHHRTGSPGSILVVANSRVLDILCHGVTSCPSCSALLAASRFIEAVFVVRISGASESVMLVCQAQDSPASLTSLLPTLPLNGPQSLRLRDQCNIFRMG